MFVKLLGWLFFTLKVAISFFVLVFIRITTPRIKIESLGKIGWVNIFIIVFYTFLIFVVSYFFF